MAENSLVSFAISLFDLLKTVFFISLPVFLIAMFSVSLHKKISKKYGLKWFQSAIVSTYLTTLVLIFFLYLVPAIISIIESKGLVAPADFPISPIEQIAFASFSLVKIFLSSAVFAILLMPVEFFGLFVFEKTEKIKLPFFAKIFLPVYFSTLIAFLILFFNPWILQGLIYMIYWA